MKKVFAYSLLLVYIRVYELIITLKHKQNMSSEIKNNPTRAAGLVPFPSFTGDSDSSNLRESGLSGPPSALRYRIEKELVGVPLHVQKDALLHLLHLLGEENASHPKNI